MILDKILVFLLLAFMIAPGSLLAETQAPMPTPSISEAPRSRPTGAPVIFSGATLFTVYDKAGSFGPQERAMAIAERLSRLAADPLTRPDTIAVIEGERASEIVSGEMVIIAVTDGDARQIGRSRQEVAQEYAVTIRHALTTSLEQARRGAMLINGAYALLVTVVLIVFLVAFYKLFPKLYEKLRGWRGTYIPSIKIQRVEVLSAGQLASALITLAKGLMVFNGVGRGTITFPGFHQEWAEPTYKIARFLVIVFAAIACFPYIPGSQSEGFRGLAPS